MTGCVQWNDIWKYLSFPGPEVIKLFFMLKSVENENLNAHKYKSIKKFNHFFGSDKI